MRKTAKCGGRIILLPPEFEHMAGRELTAKQVKAMKHIVFKWQAMCLEVLIGTLENGLLDEALLPKLDKLRDLLE
jgi:hypothetical protein